MLHNSKHIKHQIAWLYGHYMVLLSPLMELMAVSQMALCTLEQQRSHDSSYLLCTQPHRPGALTPAYYQNPPDNRSPGIQHFDKHICTLCRFTVTQLDYAACWLMGHVHYPRGLIWFHLICKTFDPCLGHYNR